MRAPGVLIVGVVVACTFACALVLGPGPAPAWAQQKPGPAASREDARARELWTRGNQLFEEGKYEEALAAFEESYRLSQRPAILVALANTYELLGRHAEAVTALRQYQPHARGDEIAVIRKRIDSLEQRVDRKEQPPGPDETGDAAGGDPVRPSGEVSGRVSGDTAPRRQRERPLGAWIVTGAGGAVVVAGLGLGLAAAATRSDIDARCGSYQGQTYCPIEVEPLIGRQRGLALGADIALGVGIATTAAGVAWLLLGGDDAETQPAISISPGLQEVRLVVRF